MKLGNLTLQGKAMLAPLEGVNDLAFRMMCAKYGSCLNFTQMLSAVAAVRKNASTLKLAATLPEEKPVGIQLAAKDRGVLMDAIKLLEHDYPDTINPDTFNINLGCPVANAMKQGVGAALLSDIDKIGDLVSGMRAATDLPVSAKIRLGINPKTADYMKLSKTIEAAGADMLIVHARYQERAYSEAAHWHCIKEIKDTLSIPVIGNGDVFDEASAKRMIDETGCDGVMLARGCIGNPFLFSRINAYLSTGKMIEQKDKFDLFMEYLDLAKKYDVGVVSIKEHAMYFTKGLQHSAKLRDTIRTAVTVSDIVERFKNHVCAKS